MAPARRRSRKWQKEYQLAYTTCTATSRQLVEWVISLLNVVPTHSSDRQKGQSDRATEENRLCEVGILKD